MRLLDAREVFRNLQRLGSDAEPAKQRYKSEIAGRYCEVLDLDSNPVLVRAENLEHYIAKGFKIAKRRS
jgi:hypothetical protein